MIGNMRRHNMRFTVTSPRRSEVRLVRRSGAVRSAATLACLGLGALQASAQAIDVEALIADIDNRAGQYDALTAILQGADPTRALAAFDVMLETGDKTLRETAISAALAATDERLRARVLWEALEEKDSITIVIDTDGLENDARTALDRWIGTVSSWALPQRFPETQCINLSGANGCNLSANLSVSGLRVELFHPGQALHGAFTLNSEGFLAGEVVNANSKAVYPATIQLR